MTPIFHWVVSREYYVTIQRDGVAVFFDKDLYLDWLRKQFSMPEAKEQMLMAQVLDNIEHGVTTEDMKPWETRTALPFELYCELRDALQKVEEDESTLDPGKKRLIDAKLLYHLARHGTEGAKK